MIINTYTKNKRAAGDIIINNNSDEIRVPLKKNNNN